MRPFETFDNRGSRLCIEVCRPWFFVLVVQKNADLISTVDGIDISDELSLFDLYFFLSCGRIHPFYVGVN